jgi:hypothetical protein
MTTDAVKTIRLNTNGTNFRRRRILFLRVKAEGDRPQASARLNGKQLFCWPQQSPGATEPPTVIRIQGDGRNGSDAAMQMSQQLPPSQMPAFPTTTGAWAVEVVTGGGLMGLTKTTAIDSGGAVACPASCVAPVRRQLDAVAAAVRRTEGLQWTLSRAVTCRDCMV